MTTADNTNAELIAHNQAVVTEAFDFTDATRRYVDTPTTKIIFNLMNALRDSNAALAKSESELASANADAQRAEDQANNLAGDVAQLERELAERNHQRDDLFAQAWVNLERAEAAEQKLTEQAATIEAVRAALDEPLDTEQVLDTHAGRALWGANQAAKARRILSRSSTSAAPVKNRPEISHVTPTSEVSLQADAVRAIKAEALREAADLIMREKPIDGPFTASGFLRARAVTPSTETTTDGEKP